MSCRFLSVTDTKLIEQEPAHNVLLMNSNDDGLPSEKLSLDTERKHLISQNDSVQVRE